MKRRAAINRDVGNAIGHGLAPPKPAMRLISWRPCHSGALRGFCNIMLRAHMFRVFLGQSVISRTDRLNRFRHNRIMRPFVEHGSGRITIAPDGHPSRIARTAILHDLAPRYDPTPRVSRVACNA
jgi:hypothetical protein